MRRIRHGGTAAALIATVLASALDGAQATILLFEETRRGGTVGPIFGVGGSSIPGDYGDRVTGTTVTVPGGSFSYGEAGEGFTPGVEVDISGGAGFDPALAALWRREYGDLVDVAYAREGAGALNILLTADPGIDVVLYGFDLGGWQEADHTIRGLSIMSGSDTLFAQSDVSVLGSDDQHTTFAFGAPLVGNEILIQIDVGNLALEDHDVIGIDNLRFGQTVVPVPEPGTALLLAAGLAVFGSARRR